MVLLAILSLFVTVWICPNVAVNPISSLPFNTTLQDGFYQPMQQTLVQGGSDTGALTDEGVVDGVFVQLNAQKIVMKVDLVEHIPTIIVIFKPAIDQWLDIGVGDVSALNNQSLLYPNPQSANIATVAQKYPTAEPDPAPSPMRRRLLEAIIVPNVTGLGTGPSSAPIVKNPGLFLSQVDCSSSVSAQQALEQGAEMGAVAGGVTTAFMGPAAGAGAFIVGGLVGGLGAYYLGGDSAKVACQVAINEQWANTQSTVLNNWLGLDGSAGAFSALNKSNYAALAFEKQADAFIDADDRRWQDQNNFTRNNVDAWLTLYKQVLNEQRNATAVDADLLKKVEEYTQQQFTQLYGSIDDLNNNLAQLSTNFQKQEVALNQFANQIQAQQITIQRELSNIYGMLEVILSQMNQLLILIEETQLKKHERRGMVLAWVQSMQAAITMGLKPFVDPSAPGVVPHSQFPPIVPLTYAQVKGTTPLIPDGTGPNFDHFTIVYTMKIGKDIGGSNQFAHDITTQTVADEWYWYIDQDFALESVPQWFNDLDIQNYLGAAGKCSGPQTCKLFANRYRHSMQCSGTQPNQYTLNNPGPGGIFNPPQYILNTLAGCRVTDSQTFPDSPNAPGDGSYNMQNVFSRDDLNNYLTSLCSNPNMVGPIYLYSWMQSQGALVNRNASVCDTSYRAMDLDAVGPSGITVQRAFYQMLSEAMQVTLLNNTFRELYKYGAIASSLTGDHIPFVQDKLGLRTKETYSVAFAATEFAMTPVYKFTPIQIVDEAIVQDSGGVDMQFNIPARQHLTLPLGAGYLFVGFLRCLFQPCGQLGRYFDDVPPNAVAGVDYAGGREDKVDYIRAPADVQSNGHRFTFFTPRPMLDLGEWLTNERVSFDANQASISSSQFRVKVFPSYPGDLLRQHVLTCDPNNTAAWNEMCQTFQSWGILTNRPDNPEETTELTFVPLEWEARAEYAEPTTPFAKSAPFYPNCPYINNVRIQQIGSSLPQMYIWNNLAYPIFLDIVFTSNITGDGQAINIEGGPCEKFIFNTTVDVDETRAYTVPGCVAERVVIWQSGLRDFANLCFDRTLNTLGQLPNDTRGAYFPPVPSYINDTVVTITSSTLVALFSMGTVLSNAIDNFQDTVVASVSAGTLTAATDAVFGNITQTTLNNQVIIMQAAANTSALYDQTQQTIDTAQIAAANLTGSTNTLISQINGYQKASAVLTDVIQQEGNNSLTAELEALTAKLEVEAGRFSKLLQVAQQIPVQPTGWEPSVGTTQALEGIADSIGTSVENDFYYLTDEAWNLLRNGFCAFSGVPLIGPIMCGGLNWLWQLFVVIVSSIVIIAITIGILYAVWKCAASGPDEEEVE